MSIRLVSPIPESNIRKVSSFRVLMYLSGTSKLCICALFFDFVVLMNSTLSGDAINTEGDRDRNINIVTYQVSLYYI